MSLRERLRGQPHQRWFVVVAAVSGIVVATLGPLTAGWPVYWSAMAGLAVAFAIMVVLGTAERLWAGRPVQQAQVPGGGGIAFGDEIRPALETLNDRVTEQMTDLNRRVYDLEKRVFKEGSIDANAEE